MKQSINLIIKKDEDTSLLRKGKLIAGILGIGSLSLFIIAFVVSLYFVNANISGFNQLKTEVGQLEKKISDAKTNE